MTKISLLPAFLLLGLLADFVYFFFFSFALVFFSLRENEMPNTAQNDGFGVLTGWSVKSSRANRRLLPNMSERRGESGTQPDRAAKRAALYPAPCGQKTLLDKRALTACQRRTAAPAEAPHLYASRSLFYFFLFFPFPSAFHAGTVHSTCWAVAAEYAL